MVLIYLEFSVKSPFVYKTNRTLSVRMRVLRHYVIRIHVTNMTASTVSTIEALHFCSPPREISVVVTIWSPLQKNTN